ncbi:MAG: heparinase II/III-family protein [Anaerolineae bacterium]|nr:heparinase II/III-family protein [Anaerolineae bacterium]
MLSQYNPVDIERILRQETPPPLFPPASDRAAWEAVRAAIGETAVRDLIQRAEEAAQSPIPVLPATLYLEFKRNGQREGYQEPVRLRRDRHTALTLAECLEHQGRFLDPLMDVTWAICEESSWAYPAHETELADLDHPIVDLFASLTGSQLAEMDLLLGTELDPLVGKRIRQEIDRRLITPYLTRHDHWWLYNTADREVNNWTAVCNGNVAIAAIHLEPDPARLAELLARAARSMDDYLSTFDVDGGSTEGPGYWSFGFGNYVLFAQAIEQRSNGRLPFMDGDLIRKVARFPLQSMLSPGKWVNFSDADLEAKFPGSLLAYLAERLDMPELVTLYHEQEQRAVTARTNELPWSLRGLFWRAAATPNEPVRVIPHPHDWYSGMHWMIARYDPNDPDALVLAAKAGHNGEMHNQNDVGSFIVHVNGEPVVADLGRGRYTRFYFSETRYDHFVCQSFGHSCPVPNGQMQGPLSAPKRMAGNQVGVVTDEMRGRNFYADLLEHRAEDSLDLIKMELKHAYPPAADLDSLVRSIALHREEPNGWVELVDEVTFASGPGTLASVLTTFGDAELGDGAVLLKGETGALHVAYDEQVVQPRIEQVEDVDLSLGPRDVRRVVFEFLKPQTQGTIRLSLVPVHKSSGNSDA